MIFVLMMIVQISPRLFTFVMRQRMAIPFMGRFPKYGNGKNSQEKKA